MCLLFSVAALIRQKPSSVIVEEGENVNLECKASGLPMPTVTWRKAFGHLPRGKTTVIDGNMTMLSVTKEDRGTYVCTVKNLLGEESAFSVVTVIDRLRFTITPPIKVVAFESSSLILNCKGKGSLEITWKRAGVNTAQLAALTRVSQKCEQFIKFECNYQVAFVEENLAWWVSRDGKRMNYWGGAAGSLNTCACGVTNSCSNGQKCNCRNSGDGWREDSGLLTDKSALPVTQIRLADLDAQREEGYHTLGKLKCYGRA